MEHEVHGREPSRGHPSPSRHEVTRLLVAWRAGDDEAREALLPLVYEPLRALAHRCFQREQGPRTLQPTALVHEVYLRLVDAEVGWRSRAHFFAVAGRLMRRVLVDEARRRGRLKRGVERPLALDALDAEPAATGAADTADRVLDLARALTRLEALDERKARVVEARIFAGLTIDETAVVLELSTATVERELRLARAWLARRLTAPAAR